MGVRLIGESSACSGNWRRVRVQWTRVGVICQVGHPGIAWRSRMGL